MTGIFSAYTQFIYDCYNDVVFDLGISWNSYKITSTVTIVQSFSVVERLLLVWTVFFGSVAEV